MRTRRLILRSLTYYWRSHAAVVAGVATAVAVLAGALLVGDSVRGSLRDLVLQRIGRTDAALLSSGFFRERLADDLRAGEGFGATFADVAPMIVAQGVAADPSTGRRANEIRVYGVDDRFWRFQGVTTVAGPRGREALVSAALASELGVQPGSTLLIRLQRPSDIPLESLHSRKDDLGRSLRLAVDRVVTAKELGDFSLEASQVDVRAVFVSLARLQQDLDVEARVNALLLAARPERAARAAGDLQRLVGSIASLDDIGVIVRLGDDAKSLVVDSEAGLLDDARTAAAARAAAGAGMSGQDVFTYLANSLRTGEREIPYSLVAAIDLRAVGTRAITTSDDEPPIVLNAWAAEELRARPGDRITLEYYLWEEPGRLVTRTNGFTVAGIVPIEAATRDFAPTYPGISNASSLTDWDPPFPIDLRRIRKVDEEYWSAYRTTPKAFVPLDAGRRLWRSRYGATTSVRILPPESQSLDAARDEYVRWLRAAIDPLQTGLAVRDVRGEGLAASRGATDFGAYFVYFSFFLVVSALLLSGLFFKLGVEQRVREVGLLRAVGFEARRVRRLFVGEGLLLVLLGALLGIAGALGYAALLMIGLRSWWVSAVGTTAITLHVSPLSLVIGAGGGVLTAVVCIWWTLRGLAKLSERSLLAGEIAPDGNPAPAGGAVATGTKRLGLGALVLGGIGGVLTLAAVTGAIDGTGAFFGAGTAFLGAALCAIGMIFRLPPRRGLDGHGWRPVSRLGLRSTGYRPGRSTLSIAVIACATFILISVDAFRRGAPAAEDDLQSGTGGYALFVESVLPIVQDPNSRAGRDALNLFEIDEAAGFEPFRLLPGDDASCLNLYEPRNPRILAPRDSFLTAGRFAFQRSLASTDSERANPWLLLNRTDDDGIVPVIADANSITYVLHKELGDILTIDRNGGQIRLRLVAALRDSIFQGELLMAQAAFTRLFPEAEGYRVVLVSAPPGRQAALAADLEEALTDFGARVTRTSDRLAAFHRVENTYLSTFQMLGGLGLLLGTVGLAALLLRNVLERRRELALLSAVGYRSRHLVVMLFAENALLLAGGLAVGTICALVAIAPAAAERGGRLPLTTTGALLLVVVFTTGLLSSVMAIRAATHGPLLESLRSD